MKGESKIQKKGFVKETPTTRLKTVEEADKMTAKDGKIFSKSRAKSVSNENLKKYGRNVAKVKNQKK